MKCKVTLSVGYTLDGTPKAASSAAFKKLAADLKRWPLETIFRWQYEELPEEAARMAAPASISVYDAIQARKERLLTKEGATR